MFPSARIMPDTIKIRSSKADLHTRASPKGEILFQAATNDNEIRRGKAHGSPGMPTVLSPYWPPSTDLNRP